MDNLKNNENYVSILKELIENCDATENQKSEMSNSLIQIVIENAQNIDKLIDKINKCRKSEKLLIEELLRSINFKTKD
jgi:hypothetical protein